MNSIDILVTPVFTKNAKQLSKRYPSFVQDLRCLRNSLLENPEQGVVLTGGFRKIRMTISSKGRGKSGGARVITMNYIHQLQDKRIILVTIYDKADQSTATDAEIKKAFKTLRGHYNDK